MTVKEEAQKFNILLEKRVERALATWHSTTAREWLDTLTHFLAEHALDDADINITVWEEYEDYCKEITVSTYVPKTDDELRLEIDNLKTRRQQEETQQLDKEYALYLELQKKFERK
jgi:hypothetical protein